jgi:hypothetical protein
MKKIIFIGFVAVASLASCKKDRTCTCTTTYSDGSPSDTDVMVITKSRKSDAKVNCLSTTMVDDGVTETTTCELN